MSAELKITNSTENCQENEVLTELSDEDQLHFAIKNSDIKTVQSILTRIDDINNVKLHLLSSHDFLKCYDEEYNTLVTKQAMTAPNKQHNTWKLTILDEALIMRTSTEIIQLLINHGAQINYMNCFGWNAFYASVCYGRTEIVELFLTHGADVNIRSPTGLTPLLFAIKHGRNCRLHIVKLLIDNGADVNLYSNEYLTPLLFAIHYGTETLVELLIKHGAAINYIMPYSLNKYTPLCLALDKQKLEIVHLLIKNGANINGPYSKLPLLLATKGNYLDVVKLILKNNTVNVNVRNFMGKTPLIFAIRNSNCKMVSLLLENGADVNMITNFHFNSTPLYLAVKYAHIEVIKLLLDYNADTSLTSESHHEVMLPLHQAIRFSRIDVMQLLLKYDADINCLWLDGNTFLHFAVIKEADRSVSFLLDIGADINVINNKGLTPFETAISNYLYSIISIFIKHVTKMLVLNAFVNDKNLKWYYNFRNLNDDEFTKFCNYEVLQLKSEKIYSNSKFALSHILTKSIHQVALILRNSEACENLVDRNFEVQYPIFADTLKHRIQMSFEEMQIMNKTNFILGEIFDCDSSIPIVCVTQILRHFTVFDMIQLINKFSDHKIID